MHPPVHPACTLWCTSRLAPLLTCVAIGLTACAPIPAALTTSPLQFVPFEGGLRVLGTTPPTGSEISFGRDWPGVLESVSGVLGAPVTTLPCGTGAVTRWADGLALRHEGGRFVGVGCPPG